jgi:hypothetical protein
MGPGEVEVQDIDFPSFTVQAGPGVPEENVGREWVWRRRTPRNCSARRS